MNNTLQHSADVDIYLDFGTARLPVDSYLGTKILLRDPVELSPCSGELVIIVDGIERRKKITFPRGIPQTRDFITFDLAA